MSCPPLRDSTDVTPCVHFRLHVLANIARLCHVSYLALFTVSGRNRGEMQRPCRRFCISRSRLSNVSSWRLRSLWCSSFIAAFSSKIIRCQYIRALSNAIGMPVFMRNFWGKHGLMTDVITEHLTYICQSAPSLSDCSYKSGPVCFVTEAVFFLRTVDQYIHKKKRMLDLGSWSFISPYFV